MLKSLRKKLSKPFVWSPLSKKQLKILSWWCEGSPYKNYDGVIADGAVRSGKTISMSPSFVLWAMTNFDGLDFALCGKTIGSLRRNVINTLKKQILTLGYKYEERRTDNLIIIWCTGLRSLCKSRGTGIQPFDDILLDIRGQIQEVYEGSVDPYNVYTTRCILLRLGQNFSKHLRRRDIHIQIEGRDLFIIGIFLICLADRRR